MLASSVSCPLCANLGDVATNGWDAMVQEACQLRVLLKVMQCQQGQTERQSVATVTWEVTARAPDVNSAVNLPFFCTTLENAGTKKDLMPGAMKIATALAVIAAGRGCTVSRTEESPFVASLGIGVDLQVRFCKGPSLNTK